MLAGHSVFVPKKTFLSLQKQRHHISHITKIGVKEYCNFSPDVDPKIVGDNRSSEQIFTEMRSVGRPVSRSKISREKSASQGIVGRAKFSAVGAQRYKGRLRVFGPRPLRQLPKIRGSAWVLGRYELISVLICRVVVPRF